MFAFHKDSCSFTLSEYSVSCRNLQVIVVMYHHLLHPLCIIVPCWINKHCQLWILSSCRCLFFVMRLYNKKNDLLVQAAISRHRTWVNSNMLTVYQKSDTERFTQTTSHSRIHISRHSPNCTQAALYSRISVTSLTLGLCTWCIESETESVHLPIPQGNIKQQWFTTQPVFFPLLSVFECLYSHKKSDEELWVSRLFHPVSTAGGKIEKILCFYILNISA